MLGFLKKLFDYNEREVNRIRGKVAEINALEDKIRTLKDEDFPKETETLKHAVRSGEKTLDDILPGAFALIRETSRRVLNQRHFDVQLIAGIALHEGKIAEQKTGEGKTLSATTALYLNALEGKGAHLVTVNDYLARRDCGWMGTIYHFLGLTTSAIISDRSFIYDPHFTDSEVQDWRLAHLREISRNDAYRADITYGINSEFGFDYLRDNMAQRTQDLVQRGFNYAVIDEADSVLIDEARTPHIISAPFDEDISKYYRYAKIVEQFDPKTDYVIDEKLRTANLTDAGVKKVESILNVTNVYEKDFDTLYHIEAALKASTLFKLDKDYIVKDGEVVIVDEFTGRLLPERRFSEGLHQAIEAKENVSIQKESKTLATVSLQNYFRMYKKLAGMTGTAATEAEEFHKIYHSDVVVVPTHMPMIRKDHADMIYKTESGKFNAVVEEVTENYKKGRPVLIGTTSIEKNEHLSRLLTKKGVPHELLNAKNHEREAAIIAKAGEKGAITVATNMAGRGVDIILGGEPSIENWQKKHDEIVGLGGLLVIGTERHEARRIDNQLRGRSGRQGDPGETRFFVSLEDDLMRIFGGEQIANLMTFFKLPEDQALTHPMVSKAIEQAQVKVEGFNFDIRKHLVDYDDVLNKQREIIYTLRRKILLGPEKETKEFHQAVLDVFYEEIATLVNTLLSLGAETDEGTTEKLIQELQVFLPVDKNKISSYADNKDIEGLIQYCKEIAEQTFKDKEKKIGAIVWKDIVRLIFLSTIDKYWMDHLTAIEDLREGINLRGYAQLDPLVEYKNEAYSMFERLVGDINFEVTRRLFRVEVEMIEPSFAKATEGKEKPPKKIEYKSASKLDPFAKKTEEAPLPEPKKVEEASAEAKITVRKVQNPQPTVQEFGGIKFIPSGTKTDKKPGRNDPCWCGSGKKYKKCHYPN